MYNNPFNLNIWRQQGGVALLPLPNEPELAAIVAAMTPAPTSDRQGVMNQLIKDLKSAGVWSKLSVLYVHAAHAEQPGRVNWINPSSWTLNTVNAPTFTTDRGFAGDGSTSYLVTSFNLLSNTVGMLHTSSSVACGAWLNTTVSTPTGNLIGGSDVGVSAFRIRYITTTTAWVARVLTGVEIIGTVPVASRGLVSFGRLLDDHFVRSAGINLVNQKVNSYSIYSNAELQIGRAGANYSSFQLGLSYLGAWTSSTEENLFQSAANDYMITLGNTG